jgi:hypothetical protein
LCLRELNSLRHERNSALGGKSQVTEKLVEKQREEITVLLNRIEDMDVQNPRVPQPGTQLDPLA